MLGGKFLSEHKAMSSYRVRELKMVPTSETNVPLLIDGDPWGLAPIHVTMMEKKIKVFCKPPLPKESAAVLLIETTTISSQPSITAVDSSVGGMEESEAASQDGGGGGGDSGDMMGVKPEDV